jgi:peptidoglycan/xylan/chitin deacetylase (PgdA/CDA1 family)
MPDPVTAPAAPRTSVVVPARNAEATLVQTLDSLLAQRDTDWEALIIDDASTDGTAALIAEYVRRDARCHALRGPGDGASAARNIGLSRARGQRLLFLDSDDWIDAQFLEVMHAALDRTPGAVAAYCAYRRVMPDGGLGPVCSNPEIALAPHAAFARSCATAIHAIVIERDVVSRVGGFDTTLQTCEDWDLWQRAARLGGRWVHVDQPLCYYRVSAQSLSADVGRMLDDARTVIGRGFAADDRRADSPAMSGDGGVTVWDATAAEAHAYFALWCAAFDCGRGGTGAAVRADFSVLPSTPQAALPIVLALFEGVMVGLRVVPQHVAARWSLFGDALTQLIEGLGTAWHDPVAARRIQYRFERLVLDYDDLADPRPLSLTMGLRVDVRNPAPCTPPDGIDRLYVYLCDGATVVAILDIGALGTITTAEWLDFGMSHVTVGGVTRWMGAAMLASLTPTTLRSAVRGGIRAACTAPWRADVRGAMRRVASDAFAAGLGSVRPAGSHRERLDAMHRDAMEPVVQPAAHLDAPVLAAPLGADRHAYWERLFQQPDPWRYGNAYEQEKYARQLSLLPSPPITRALELACAEGHFTTELAGRVHHLIATDISATALERARARCAPHANIEFRQFDLVADVLPAALDLLVCSEVLYYLEDVAVLEEVAARFAAALTPGGHLLTAHAFVLAEDRSKTGFDWGHRWGATTIARTFSAVPQLALERSIQTELYRIDLFVRVPDQLPMPTPVIEHATMTAELEDDVARHVIWGGASARRAELKTAERPQQLPVLMYHSVAADGPVELARYRVTPEDFQSQMTWLRRHGYHTITSEELEWFLANRHPFVGRPVVITFDDGLQDFADVAWPMLRRCDFGAEVFVVTDFVGQTSAWEAKGADTTPLMAASTITRLASEGVTFGSHLATHRSADGLSTHELAGELVRSRAMLQRWTTKPVHAVAAPFGLTDQRLRGLAAQCGYRVGYSTRDAVAQLTSDAHEVPRIEVRGDWTLDEFIARMEASR